VISARLIGGNEKETADLPEAIGTRTVMVGRSAIDTTRMRKSVVAEGKAAEGKKSTSEIVVTGAARDVMKVRKNYRNAVKNGRRDGEMRKTNQSTGKRGSLSESRSTSQTMGTRKKARFDSGLIPFTPYC
jgi:hypothetical protein